MQSYTGIINKPNKALESRPNNTYTTSQWHHQHKKLKQLAHATSQCKR